MDSGRIRMIGKARQPIPQRFLIRPWRGAVEPAIRKDMAFKAAIREQRGGLFSRRPIPGGVQRKDMLDLISIRCRKRPAGTRSTAKCGRWQGSGLNGPLRCGWKGASKPQGRQDQGQ
jgi:hypothetical protein